MKNRKRISYRVQLFKILTGLTFNLAVVFFIITALGCARKHIEGSMIYMASGDTISGPEWITGDCASFWNGKLKNRICAVGSNNDGTNIAELRKRAIEEAENKVTGELKARIQAVTEYFGKSRQGRKEFGHPANLELMRKISDRISNDAIKFAEVNDFWITPANEVYALVSIDQIAFNDALDRISYISEDLKHELNKQSKSIVKLAEQDLRKMLEEKAKKLL